MPGTPNYSSCPKGEKWDNKKKVCVKKTRKVLKKPRVHGHTIKRKQQKKKRGPRRTIKVTLSVNKMKAMAVPKSTSPIEIPFLSNIEDKLEHRQISYFKDLLINIVNYVPSEKAYTNVGSFYYKTLDDILDILQQDIKSIREKYHSKSGLYFGDEERTEKFGFGDDEIREVVLSQLEDYVVYFKKVADKEDRVDIEDIDVLMK
jgi:hypothetical protein